MATACYDINLLKYSGTSQAQRLLQALLSQYAKVDERSTAQLILFAKKYGAYLSYYDITNQISGDWQDFMAKDISVTIAAIADWKIKQITPFVEIIKDKIENAADADEAKKYFKTIFDLVFTLASQLNDNLQRLPQDIRFTNFLSIAITSNLAIPLATLNQYYIAFRDAPLSLIEEASGYIDAEMPVTPVLLSGNFDINQLSDAWKISLFAVPPVTLGGIDVKEDINHVLTHNLFTGPLQLFINGVINIVSKTPAYLEETLNNYPLHEPHYALYLAFLRLFRFAQNHINNYTKNHLDFYYKDVLQLHNRNAEPGFVHLLFELQKNINQYLLKKDTLFRGGKDANNNDVYYAITDDVVLQKASVQSVQSLYLTKGAAGALYASPVANSDDGNGGKLTSADNSWFPFGDPKKIAGADIGFAIASNVLFLNEGVRTITFTFQCSAALSITNNDLIAAFNIQLTGKKDWYTVDTYTPSVNGDVFILAINLTGDAPPIVPYSQKIHGGSFTTTLPIAQITLINNAAYQRLKNIRLNSITLSVSATVKNLSLQNGDGKINAAKPFKPFGDFPEKGSGFIIGSKEIFQKPLTSLSINFNWQPVDTSLAQAVADASPEISLVLPQLYESVLINSMNAEAGAVAANTLNASAALNANVTATALSGGTLAQSKMAVSDVVSQTINDIVFGVAASPVPADLVALSAGEWSSSAIESSDNLLSNAIALSASDAANIPITDADFNASEEYSINAVDGFIKLDLKTAEYSLATYLSNLQKAAQQTSVKVNYDGDKVTSYTVDPPKLSLPAPELVANGVSVSYTASTEIDFTDTGSMNNAVAYYHKEPFGWREMHPLFTDEAITLLPLFNLDNGDVNDTGGELWIGFKDAFPDETLSVLFEVSDGSANPLKNRTELHWYYLSNNNWLSFDDLAIVDGTNNLTRSGIVTITLPNNITSNTTRADAGLIWIKLVADHDTDAVCKLIAVRTNAAKATFVQDLTKGIEYTTMLPAGTISKPAAAIASIKKTEQPYASFGGRLHETDDQFYIRVSERLRHKHRAVTTWDYERLVLEYFPQVHKAKCINHTGFFISQKTNKQQYSEVLPGHAMVVTVPDLKSTTNANLLRPYTSIGLIEEIQQYLEKLTSPFVRLHVTNPQFEEVQFDFEVTFLPNYDITFYTKQLNDEVEQFLTPWAYESGRDIEFGGKIEKSVVLNFVEERSYVDFVTCFIMHHFIRDEENVIVQKHYNIEEAVASTARSILVSYKDEDTGTRHLIQSPANCNCNG